MSIGDILALAGLGVTIIGSAGALVFKIGMLVKSIDGLRDEFRQHRTEVNNRIDRLDERQDDMVQRISAIEAKHNK